MTPIRFIIGPGIGFSPGSVGFIVTRGFGNLDFPGSRRMRQIKALTRRRR